MFLRLLQKIVSFRVDESREQSVINRTRRINIFYLLLFVIFALFTLYSVITGPSPLSLVNGITLVLVLGSFFAVSVGKRPDLSSMLALVLTALFLIGAYFFDMGVSTALILAFYLIYPLAAVSVNGKQGIFAALALGIGTLVLNSLPQVPTSIHLDLYNALVFFTLYFLVVVASVQAERSNRALLTRLIDSKTQVEHRMVEKDVFISRLSHKLRTSLSNIALINSLVHDERFSSEQRELMDTLRASTNLLIKDVNNIVEIASPGIVDYRRSITSFDLTSVLDESLSILKTGEETREDMTIIRSDTLNHHIIGDPGLVRSLIVNIIHGVNDYRTLDHPVNLQIKSLRLKRLEQWAAENTNILTESQIQALEQAKEEREAHGEAGRAGGRRCRSFF